MGRSVEREEKEEAWCLSSTGFSSQMTGAPEEDLARWEAVRGKRVRVCRKEGLGLNLQGPDGSFQLSNSVFKDTDGSIFAW